MLTALFAALLLQLSGTQPAPPPAEWSDVEAEVDRLAAQGKYLSAVSAITSHPERMASARLLRKATHLLVTYYVINVNFGLFALRDLSPGERIEDVRGKPGTYSMIGGDWERVLDEAIAAHPDDPDLSFAIGEYLSRGAACGCGSPTRFTGERGDDYRWFERARRGGIVDAWSLFRMGLHHLSSEPQDLRRAVAFFDEALALAPDDVAAHYDKAAALMLLGDAAGALVHSGKALGRYGNAALDADTYNLHARIELKLGDAAGAERDFARALSLLPHHSRAFTGLLDRLRARKDLAEYRRRVLAFAGLDYANTFPLGVWVEYLADAGVLDVDRKIAKALAARTYASPREEGAVFYNLGQAAKMDGDRAGANRHFRRSLSALKRQEKPPDGATEVLSRLIAATSGD